MRNKKKISVYLLSSLILSGFLGCISKEPPNHQLKWVELPHLPKSSSVAGPFVGTTGNTIIVAGGTRISPQDGERVWSDQIYVLEPESQHWEQKSRLPIPLAHGASISTTDGLLLIGGKNKAGISKKVYRLTLQNHKIQIEFLPDLPAPCVLSGATSLHQTLYVAGGLQYENPSISTKNFWALNLSSSTPQWKILKSWPGPDRISPIVVEQAGKIYVFSGIELFSAQDGVSNRNQLKDGYSYQPSGDWVPVTDLLTAAATAPGLAVGQSHVLVFGDNNDRLVYESEKFGSTRPTLSRDIQAYHTITDTWITLGSLPTNFTPLEAMSWKKKIVLAGEERFSDNQSLTFYAGQFQKLEAHFAILDYICLGAYLLVLVTLGIYFSGRGKTTQDFFLAGHRVPWWAAGLSIFGTQLSAITFMAIPAKVYATDWTYFWGITGIILVSPIVVYVYLPFFRRLNLTTIYEYLERRFDRTIRLCAGASFILFHLGRISVVLFLPAAALSTVTGINIYICILVMGILCTFYTGLGGIEAVIWSDLLQVVVLLGGGLACLVIIVAQVPGGLNEIISVAVTDNKFHSTSWTWDPTTTGLWVLVVGNFFVNLITYTSDQAVVQRYLTTKNEKQAAKAIWANVAITIPESVIWFGLGTALYVFYKIQPHLLSLEAPTDTILPFFAVQQLPIGISGLVIAGLFAAAMSTVDSSLHSIATTIVTDFYRCFYPNKSDRSYLNLARWLVVLLGIAATSGAIVLSTLDVHSLWDLLYNLIGLFSSAMGGLFVLGIFTRRANAPGALTGMITSYITLYVVQNYTALHFFLYGAIGLLTCFTIGYLSSFLFCRSKIPLQDLTLFTRPD